MTDGGSCSRAFSPRQIRVFASSTFLSTRLRTGRDMQAERDHLVKIIFPQLRKLCEMRGVTSGETDLRRGVTDEQKAEGGTIPICLAEIQRSRGCPAEILEEKGFDTRHRLLGQESRSLGSIALLEWTSRDVWSSREIGSITPPWADWGI